MIDDPRRLRTPAGLIRKVAALEQKCQLDFFHDNEPQAAKALQELKDTLLTPSESRKDGGRRNTGMTPLGKAALGLGARGIRVFPCWPRKKEPAIRDNLRLASIDATIIRKWWSEKDDYNVAIACGRASGIWVLDIDADDGGEATLRELESKHGALPPTVEAITANGRHLYWRWPDNGIEIRNWQVRDDLPGIDGRGEGGYVLAPPSIHPSGRAYAWSVDSASELAFAPEWLIKIAVARNERKSDGLAIAPTPSTVWTALIEQDHEGSRRAFFIAKLFGYLIRKYLDADVAFAIAERFNATNCKPSLGRDELIRITADIAEIEIARREAAANGR